MNGLFSHMSGSPSFIHLGYPSTGIPFTVISSVSSITRHFFPSITFVSIISICLLLTRSTIFLFLTSKFLTGDHIVCKQFCFHLSHLELLYRTVHQTSYQRSQAFHRIHHSFQIHFSWCPYQEILFHRQPLTSCYLLSLSDFPGPFPEKHPEADLSFC